MTSDILVESFDVDIGASGSTYTLTNDVGAIANAFVRKMTSTDKATGRVGNTGNMSPVNAHAGVLLTNTDELTFYKGNANTQKIVGEVWRYDGASGGDNEFINRGTYAITLNSGTASATQAVTGLVDRNKAVPVHVGLSTTTNGTSDYDTTTVGVYINSSDEIVVERQSTGSTITVYVNVVEFTGANWLVGHGVDDTGNVAGGSLKTVTMNTDSTGAGGSTFDVGDWATAMILDASMQGDTAETGLADVLLLPRVGATTTTLKFELVSGGNNNGARYFHILQHDDMSITRNSTANYPEGNNSYTTASFPSGTPTDRSIDELALEWFASTSGAGTAHARGRLTAQITDSTGTIQHWTQRSGNTVRARWGVVDLSQIQSASPPAGTEATLSSTQNDQTGTTTTAVSIGATVTTSQASQASSSSTGIAITCQSSTDQDDNITSAGASVSIGATLSITQGGQSSTAQSDVSITASLILPQDSHTATGIGSVVSGGAITSTQDAQASSGQIRVDIGATMGAYQQGNALSSQISASSLAGFTADMTQDGNTASSLATVSVGAQVSAGQQSDTATGSNDVHIGAVVDAGQESHSMSAGATIDVGVSLNTTQDAQVSTGSSSIDIDAQGQAQGNDNTLTALCAVTITANASITQADNTLLSTFSVGEGLARDVEFFAYSQSVLSIEAYKVKDVILTFESDDLSFACYGGANLEFSMYSFGTKEIEGFIL